MEELKERILREGKVIGNDILKVDSFINYQVDPVLMAHIGDNFAEYFKDKGITKIITIESSGIAPALMTANAMGIPMVILKKQPSKELNNNTFQTQVTSFTTRKEYELCLSADVISSDDHVLIIDDFLADGEAVTGAIRLVRMAHATVAGIGILIEKSFQPGYQKLKSQGFDIHSLVKIKDMDQYQITFTE
ncbi:MAG: xanthine phosphoribosyltransferase [Agathobacter sp.]|nr:xanthine phosphoribosyltransferase [Agathobacter sp.]